MNVTPLLSMVYNYGIMEKSQRRKLHLSFSQPFSLRVLKIIQIAKQMPCDSAEGFKVKNPPWLSQSLFLDNKPTLSLPPFIPNILLYLLSVMYYG